MIAIISDDYNAVVIRNETLSFPMEARLSRTKNLDGSVSSIHRTFTDSDRTATITGNVSIDNETTLRQLIRDGETVSLSTPDGIFPAMISRLDDRYGLVSITLYCVDHE